MKKIDFHVHIHGDLAVPKMAEYLTDMCARKGYEGVGIMALPHSSEGCHPDCNKNALELKKLMPDSYAFAGLFLEKDFVEQAKEYMACGFDGIKLLSGKPSEYRLFGYGYEDERFTAFFDYCEKEQIPLLIHNADPKYSWDITKATQRAIDNGWVYDETLPSQEWFLEALEKQLFSHKKLRAAIAHFGFYSDDFARAHKIMETCPNVYMDLTPAIDIYEQFSERAPEAEAFFRKYNDRLIYGTDADADLTGFRREYNDIKTDIITAFLEGSEPVTLHGRKTIVPIALEEYMLENIYYNNALRFMGK